MWCLSLLFGFKSGKTMKVILGWSGGLDSTYALWYYLTQTDYKVHAHHIYIQQKEKILWKAEGEACRKIVKYISENSILGVLGRSDFVYSYGQYRSPAVSLDQDIILFMLSQIALTSRDDCFVALGIVKEDYDRWVGDVGYYPTVGRDIFKLAITNGDFVWGKGKQLHKIDPEIKMPLKDLTKKDIIERIPPSLLNLTWSCRYPIEISETEYKPCNKCRACKERNEW